MKNNSLKNVMLAILLLAFILSLSFSAVVYTAAREGNFTSDTIENLEITSVIFFVLSIIIAIVGVLTSVSLKDADD